MKITSSMLPSILATAVCILSYSNSRGSDVAQLAAESINRIASHDVVFKVDHLAYMNGQSTASSPLVVLTEHMHDTFASGLGRRVEKNIGVDDHPIAIATWHPESLSNAKELSYGLPGLNYFDYYNPNCDGLFLLSLLADRLSQIKPLEAAVRSGEELPGFELSHPKLNGPIRVWVSTSNGYMPARIDAYVKTKEGEYSRYLGTENKKFAKIEDDVWVPIEGEVSTYVAAGPTVGQKITGFRLQVDLARSSWNSIATKKPFLQETLPEHNWTEANWKCYYPSDKLSALKANAETWATATQPKENGHRLLWIAMNVFVVVLIAIMVLLKKARSRIRLSS